MVNINLKCLSLRDCECSDDTDRHRARHVAFVQYIACDNSVCLSLAAF